MNGATSRISSPISVFLYTWFVSVCRRSEYRLRVIRSQKWAECFELRLWLLLNEPIMFDRSIDRRGPQEYFVYLISLKIENWREKFIMGCLLEVVQYSTCIAMTLILQNVNYIGQFIEVKLTLQNIVIILISDMQGFILSPLFPNSVCLTV
jgi:hypothetical protein